MNKEKIKYCNLASGDSTYFRNIAIPLAEELENQTDFLFCLEKKRNVINPYEIKSHVVNDLPVLAGVFGVGFFLSKWVLSKFLDEVYDIKLKPIFRNIINKANGTEIIKKRNGYHVFLVSVYYEDLGKVIVVALKEKELDNITDYLETAREVHISALDKINSGKDSNFLYLYLIEQGIVSEPLGLNNFNDVFDKLRT